jgi:hypothetical protein
MSDKPPNMMDDAQLDSRTATLLAKEKFKAGTGEASKNVLTKVQEAHLETATEAPVLAVYAKSIEDALEKMNHAQRLIRSVQDTLTAILDRKDERK